MDIHDINTHNNYNLHLLCTNLSTVKKGVLFSGSKIYNHLPKFIKLLSGDVKHFQSLLRSDLIEYTMYSIDEFYKTTSQWLALHQLLLSHVISVSYYCTSSDMYKRLLYYLLYLWFYIYNDRFYIL
jgi:hypothetical protein